jgi:hypothetical protein
MRRLTKRERVLAILTGTISLASILYAYVLEPSVLALVDVYGRAQKAETDMTHLRALSADSKRIEQDYDRLVSTAKRGATEEAMRLELLDEAASIASSCQLEVDSVKPVKQRLEGAQPRIVVELQGHGEAQAFTKMLTRLQSEDHLLACDLIVLAVGTMDAPVRVTLRISKAALGGR